MKFALVNSERREAQPNLIGLCIGCSSPMVARCGAVRIKHWSHKRRTRCDSWWERETEWHRSWKNQFPDDWQEIVHHADDGEKHIADIKTPEGWVIEFQHSHIQPQERRSREDFYKRLVWVVDGNRRINDKKKFFKVLGNINGRWITDQSYPELKTTLPEGSLFLDWIGSSSHVFFDFCEEDLWWLLPNSQAHCAYLIPIARSKFIHLHRELSTTGVNEFDLFIKKYDLVPPKPRGALVGFSL
jgi:competence protein CoiA